MRTEQTMAHNKLAPAETNGAHLFGPSNKQQQARRRSNKNGRIENFSAVILYNILIHLVVVILFTTLANNGKGGARGALGAPISTQTVSIVEATAEQQQQQQFINSVAPTIDYSHNMRILKLPRSTQVGSLIYRLKGSDADANTQLVFGVSGIEGRALLDVIQAGKSWNEADVFLRSPLEQTIYNLTIYVTDGNKTTQVDSTIFVTDLEEDYTSATTSNNNNNITQESPPAVGLGSSAGTTPLSPFVNPKHVFHVPENAKLDEAIGSVVALESQKSDLPVKFELRGKGAEKFAIKYVFGPTKGQSRAEIVLAQLVDYERQNLFNLKVLALNAWTNTRFDTRNVATMDIVITVGDVQDTGPVFKSLPQRLKLANTLKVGQVVAKVEAEDGDYGDQRPVNYALDASSPLASYFDIDKLSGEIKLTKSVAELALHAAWDSAAWSMLNVFASEQPDTSSYLHLWPPMLSKAEIPLMLVDVINEPPRFVGGWQTQPSTIGGQKQAAAPAPDAILHGYLSEPSVGEDPSHSQVRWYTNSTGSTGWPLLDKLSKEMQGRPVVLDLGLGSNGTFELSLEGEDGRFFELDPLSPVTKQTTFSLSVKQLTEPEERALFDHDNNKRTSTGFSVDIVARDFGTSQRLASRVRCVIELVDLDDNSPQFDTDLYIFSVYENAASGQLIGQVRARDPDTGEAGRVRYTALSGYQNQLFKLNPDSGQLTLEGHLDREKRSHYLFLVEARDSSGTGKANYTQVQLNVLDVNDNAPQFLQQHYDAVLMADGSFHQPLVVRAIDPDEAQSANSQVAYEIIAGNQNDLFYIDSLSGAIYPTQQQTAGEHNKQINNHNQLPSILSEPIVPYSTSSESPPTRDSNSSSSFSSGQPVKPDGFAGKILPAHEVEETTYPPLGATSIWNNLQHQSAAGSGGQPRAEPSSRARADYSTATTTLITNNNSTHHNHSASESSPLSADDPYTVQYGDSPFTSSGGAAQASQNPRFDWPRAATLAPSGGDKSTNSQSNKTTMSLSNGKRITLPPVDAEQLPALDLLLSLDSEHLASTIGSGSRQHQRRSLLPATAYTAPQVIRAPPLTTLVVRAHDFGIPLRSSTVKVNIYNQAMLSRSLSVILNGTVEQLEQRREQIERAFSSMTGSRATIESFDALSESSAISVARVRLAVPQHSLVDLTDLSALMNAIDYHPPGWDQPRYQLGGGSSNLNPNHQPLVPHYNIGADGQLTPSIGNGANHAASNITSGKNIYGDVFSHPLEPMMSNNGPLERRLLIYIIIVAVCILALLVVWMIYSCSREDQQVKIGEKSASQFTNGNYRSTGAGGDGSVEHNNNHGTRTQSTNTNKTFAKTTSLETSGGETEHHHLNSPIGNQLAKTTTRRHQSRPSAATAATQNSINELLLPGANQLRAADHYSMYNGQVWFEPNGMVRTAAGVASGGRPVGGPRMMKLNYDRRASSAPSTGGLSLDSALHSAIGANSQEHHRRVMQGGAGLLTPRNASGQFFPNTLGYMENLASLTQATSEDAYNHTNNLNGLAGAKSVMGRRGRGRKVGPMSSEEQNVAPKKPPRASQSQTGHTNEAYSDDEDQDEDTTANSNHNHNHNNSRRSLNRQEATASKARGGAASHSRRQKGRAHRRDSTRDEDDNEEEEEEELSEQSSLEESVVLDSDQELLGFDSTGTPIIATHTRPNANKSSTLLIDMLEPPQHTGSLLNPADPRLVLSPAAQPMRGLARQGVQPANQLLKQQQDQSRPTNLSQKSGEDSVRPNSAVPATPVGVAQSTTSAASNSVETQPQSGTKREEKEETGRRPSPTDGATEAPYKNQSQSNLRIEEETEAPEGRLPSSNGKQQSNPDGVTVGALQEFRESPQERNSEATVNMLNLDMVKPNKSGNELGGSLSNSPTSRSGSGGSRKFRGDELRKANTRVDMMSELSERLNNRRQQSVDGGVGGSITQQPTRTMPTTGREAGGAKRLELSSREKMPQLASASEDAKNNKNNNSNSPVEEPTHLRDMNNGELLEKQSIFALTYSGLTTDKLPG